MLAVPSFIPNRLRGVSWVRVVEEVRLKPSWDQRMVTVPRPDPGEVADRVEDDLGVVGAGLDADVAARFEPGQFLARERGKRLQRRRAPAGEAEAGAVEEARGRSRW